MMTSIGPSDFPASWPLHSAVADGRGGPFRIITKPSSETAARRDRSKVTRDALARTRAPQPNPSLGGTRPPRRIPSPPEKGEGRPGETLSIFPRWRHLRPRRRSAASLGSSRRGRATTYAHRPDAISLARVFPDPAPVSRRHPARPLDRSRLTSGLPIQPSFPTKRSDFSATADA